MASPGLPSTSCSTSSAMPAVDVPPTCEPDSVCGPASTNTASPYSTPPTTSISGLQASGGNTCIVPMTRGTDAPGCRMLPVSDAAAVAPGPAGVDVLPGASGVLASDGRGVRAAIASAPPMPTAAPAIAAAAVPAASKPPVRTPSAPPETAAATSSTAIDATSASELLPLELPQPDDDPPLGPPSGIWSVTTVSRSGRYRGRTRCHSPRGTTSPLMRTSPSSAKPRGNSFSGMPAIIPAMVGMYAATSRTRHFRSPAKGRCRQTTGSVGFRAGAFMRHASSRCR